MQIYLLRHAWKNNDPKAHGTGVEALLDPAKIPEIKGDAARRLITARDGGYRRIEIWTTPIDRAIATGKVQYEVMRSSREIEVVEPQVNALIGSAALHPETGKAVNLGTRAMSKIWGDAKKDERYDHLHGENKPLYAWFEQGFDNPHGWLLGKPETWNNSDPGITLREIAWRVGAFLYETLEKGEKDTQYLAFGHSGDIEPWAALTMQMIRGKDDGRTGTTWEDLPSLFNELGGALEPLTGVCVHCHDQSVMLIDAAFGRDIICNPRVEDILQEQARLYRENGVSNKVLTARLEADYKASKK